jgi:error-prone DNA polymerase
LSIAWRRSCARTARARADLRCVCSICAEGASDLKLALARPSHDAANILRLFRDRFTALEGRFVREHVLQDYATIRMPLKAHPVGLLRERFASLGYVKADQLPTLTSGRRVKVAGIVLVRQRPDRANGVVFATLEDETGVANIIIWQKIFDTFRRVVLGSRLLGVKGKLQIESDVIHVVAAQLTDLSVHLEQLSEALPPRAHFLANADEVRRPVNEDVRVTRCGPSAQDHARVLPKGRNFQ